MSARVLRVLALLLACVMALALCCSCRPTDFFTEVIISPFADEVDEDNPQKTIVNSPDAEEESDQLAALDWTDDAARSSEVQNLVTYSDHPTSTLLTHHSIFDLSPRFPGVQSSDPVTLDYSVPSTQESESNPTPTETDYSADASTNLEGSEAINQGLESQSGASNDGNVESENQEVSGDGSADQSGNPDGGMGGTINLYNPSDAFSEPQKANHVAATGQAAVLVQVLGGKGALCAIDESTYYGTGETTSNFSTIFAQELAEDFEQNALMWTGSGLSADSVKDIDALVAACGQDGVLLYDQSQGGYASRFNEAQQQALIKANIQLIPVDFSSVQGMLDAASVIGRVLSESTECQYPAQDMASTYIQTVSDIVSAAANSHGGSLAARDESAYGSRLLTDYNTCPVGSYTSTHLFCALGTSYIEGISYTNGSFIMDTTGGLLFTRTDNSSPLSFWAQAAGVWDRAADLSSAGASSYSMIYGIETGAYFNQSFFSGASGGAVLAATQQALLLSSSDTNSGLTGESHFGDGLGSASFPYLIVSASGNKTANQVKQSVVAQMDSNAPLNAYSILPWTGQSPASTDVNGNTSESIIGSTSSNANGNVFIDQGVSVPDSVRANPTGLLGSWTEGSMESVLESVWLARIYSAAPENSQYSPICNYSKDKLRETVQNFYSTFYRVSDLSSAYSSVVTDEGL